MKEFSLEEYLKNPDREVVTRNGRKVRIICTDRKGDSPIIALVHNADDGQEVGYAFYPDGKYFIDKDDEFDLFFAPEKHEGWVNIYKEFESNSNYMGRIYNSEEEAKKKTDINGIYLATIKVEWEE